MNRLCKVQGSGCYCHQGHPHEPAFSHYQIRSASFYCKFVKKSYLDNLTSYQKAVIDESIDSRNSLG